RLSCLTKELYEASKAAARAGTTPARLWPDPAEQQADALFPGILGEPAGAPRYYVVFQLDDPQQRVAGVAFREPAGRLLPVMHRKAAHGLTGFYFNLPVPEKLAALIYLAVPEAVEKARFTIRDIALP
ncbi:MAG TPA: hypothetical protein P5233_11015, partial [Candidatus Paceibacterota bacterium]|nr:hypothetical protein [Candidatus Paceibacterota bacterium]